MPGATANHGPLHVWFDHFELDEANARLLVAGQPVALPPTPFSLLCALAARPGTLLSKHTLLDLVWGHRFVSDSVLKGAISDIRNVLADDPRQPRYIETVPRRGYRFLAKPSKAVREPDMPAGGGAVAPTTGATRPSAKPGRGFVGRQKELAILSGAWERASNGQRVIAWVAGEPGIGKSALIDQFIAGMGDIRWSRGQCLQGFGTSEPYHAVLEAISGLARRDPSVAPLLRDIAPTWLLQLPWLTSVEQREALLRELAGVNPDRMLREMGEFLDQYAAQRPLLLVTEDLHWADRATVQLMEYVARRTGQARLLWLSSFRLAEVVAYDHPLDALRNILRAQGLCTEVVLDAFSGQEIAAYLAGSVPGVTPDDHLVRALQDRTEGVPLFVASLAGEVGARLSAGERLDQALADIPVPQSLSALIEHYLARLAPAQRELLTAAATIGMGFHVQTLARVLDRDAPEVGDACDLLAQGHYWLVAEPDADPADAAAGGHYSFRHALYRQVLLEKATRVQRTEMHRRVGMALEQERASGRDITAGELAPHFERGRLFLPAVRHYAEAAESAIHQLRPGECLAYAERGLALLSQLEAGVERAGYALTLATLRGVASFHTKGAGFAAREAFGQAAGELGSVPDHPMRGLLLHAFGFLLSLRAENDEALLTAARAEALGDTMGDPLLMLAAGTIQGQVHNVQGRPEAARRALERALPVIASLGPASETRLLGFIADPEVTVRGLLALPLLHLGQLGQAREQLDLAIARARRLAQPMSVMVALWCQALFETRIDDVARVAAVAGEMQALVDRFALAQGRTACRWFLGWAESRRGNGREAYQAIRAALDENLALGMWSGATETLAYAAEAQVAAGDLDGARQTVDEALALVGRNDERIFLVQLRLIEADLASRRGDAEATEAALRAALREARDQAAPWLEVQSLVCLLEHGSPTDDDRAALAASMDRVQGAEGMPLWRRARQLLHASLPPKV